MDRRLDTRISANECDQIKKKKKSAVDSRQKKIHMLHTTKPKHSTGCAKKKKKKKKNLHLTRLRMLSIIPPANALRSHSNPLPTLWYSSAVSDGALRFASKYTNARRTAIQTKSCRTMRMFGREEM